MEHNRITAKDCVRVQINRQDFINAIMKAQKTLENIKDRFDLHDRDDLERFINTLMGTIAEKMVGKWLKEQGLRVKDSETLDYDLTAISANGKEFSISVKSSLSAFKSLEDILEQFTIAITPEEASKANIHVQVYFWLNLHSRPRTTVPSLRNAAIIGWCALEHLERLNVSFDSYATEERRAPKIKLSQLQPMASLAEILLNI